jgi:hypothetical protein
MQRAKQRAKQRWRRVRDRIDARHRPRLGRILVRVVASVSVGGESLTRMPVGEASLLSNECLYHHANQSKSCWKNPQISVPLHHCPSPPALSCWLATRPQSDSNGEDLRTCIPVCHRRASTAAQAVCGSLRHGFGRVPAPLSCIRRERGFVKENAEGEFVQPCPKRLLLFPCFYSDPMKYSSFTSLYYRNFLKAANSRNVPHVFIFIPLSLFEIGLLVLVGSGTLKLLPNPWVAGGVSNPLAQPAGSGVGPKCGSLSETLLILKLRPSYRSFGYCIAGFLGTQNRKIL